MTNSTGFYGGIHSITRQPARTCRERLLISTPEWGPIGQDVRHDRSTGTLNTTLTFPLGATACTVPASPLILDELVGGWKVGMTGVSYSGFPVNISATNNSGVNGNSQRSNHLRPLKISHRSINNFGSVPIRRQFHALHRASDNGVCASRSTCTWNLRHRSSHVGTCTGLPDLRCLRHQGLHHLRMRSRLTSALMQITSSTALISPTPPATPARTPSVRLPLSALVRVTCSFRRSTTSNLTNQELHFRQYRFVSPER